MKHSVLLALVLGLAVLAPAPRAQQPAPPATPSEATPKPDAPKPGADSAADPFIRDGKKKTPDAAKPEEPEILRNVYGFIEYVEVPRKAWLAWSAANPVHGEATALRAEVQKWIVAGQAKPIDLTCMSTKSGQRAVIQSIVERRFPTGFLAAEPVPVPDLFETRDTHLTFEWEPVLVEDSFIDSNLVTQLVTFHAPSRTPAERPAARPGDGGQPRFFLQKPTLSMTSPPSQPMLVQVATPPDETGKPRDDVRVLQFFRAAPVTVKMPAAPPAAPAAKADNERRVPRVSGTFEVERLEVTLSDLDAWFAGQALDTACGGLRAAALEWIRAGRGREVDRQPSPVISGQRAVFENLEEFRYQPQISTNRPPPPELKVGNFVVGPTPTPTPPEPRQIGYSVELEAIVGGPDGRYIDLNTVCSDTRYCGNTVFPSTKLDGKIIPEVEQAAFGVMKVITSICVGNGEPALLAINTPFDEQGRPQPERKILTFVTIRP